MSRPSPYQKRIRLTHPGSNYFCFTMLPSTGLK